MRNIKCRLFGHRNLKIRGYYERGKICIFCKDCGTWLLDTLSGGF